MKHSSVLPPNKEYKTKRQCHDANITTNQAIWLFQEKYSMPKMLIYILNRRMNDLLH